MIRAGARKRVWLLDPKARISDPQIKCATQRIARLRQKSRKTAVKSEIKSFKSLIAREKGTRMLKVYGLKNCDSCRKVMKVLDGAELVDVRAEGVPEAVMQAAYEQFGDALANTRSTTWRNLGEAERKQPVLALIQEHPALMKRPLIERDGTLYLGWGKDTQDALL
jgi:arsenate reductase